MTPAGLAQQLLAAVTDAVAAGELAVTVPVTVTVERPRNRDHGDYASNVALQLAKPAGLAPRQVAEQIAVRLRTVDGIAAVDIAGPGFLNITLDSASAGELARSILIQGEAYGRCDDLAGQRINVEFISANPTGPLHLGHTRWAAVGDALARVLSATGASVTREFYINDRGVQLDRFGASVMAAAHGHEVPTDGYHGGYISDVAAKVTTADPGLVKLPTDEQLPAFREAAYKIQLADQQRVLDGFRTHFDVWYSERDLHLSGAVERAFARFAEQGRTYEADGALWLRTTDFGDDKDRVLRKSDGELTYFASDTAYYVDKRFRGFDTCIYLLGADHHGYVNRLRAVAFCAGDDPNFSIDVLIGQMVKIMSGGDELKLSKRAGTIVTLSEFVELVGGSDVEAGVDAVRYTLIRYPADSPLTLDIADLAKRSNENPVFYVQYVAARTAGIIRNAYDLGFTVAIDTFDPGLLAHERESALLGALGEFPRVLASAAQLRQPHRIARYLEDLAADFHRFYDDCRVLPVGDEPVGPLNSARLVLVAATRQVLENGLDLLGVRAPQRM